MEKQKRPDMKNFVWDLPNLCSLAGLLCAAAGLFAGMTAMYRISVIAMLWAVVFDWADGIAARRMKSRTPDDAAFGAQLDSMIDMISFGACPAVFLLSYGRFHPVFFPGAFVILATAALRLSFFNVYGLMDPKTYRGLALDNNILLFGLVFTLEPVMGQRLFSAVLYLLFMVLAWFNLARIQTPKFSSRWFVPLVCYVVVLSVLIGR